MCCIFTCCGWVIDLVQRFWTFAMSCCIGSAVCCSLLTACMSGVALGYNYSLAEYIDLKETNVSVYLKRGIFDDEVSDDMEWRRSGHKPIDGFINEDKLITGESDEPTSMRSGRRLDDSIYESNDKHSFEGSLMRLTAKPPADITPLVPTRTSEVNMAEVVQPFESGSLDELKAIQSAINMRKAAAVAGRRITTKSEEVVTDGRRRLGNSVPDSGHEIKYEIPPFDKFAPNSPPPYINPLRVAVPDDQINRSYKWRMPNLPPQEVYPPPHRVPEAQFDNVIGDFRRASPVTPRAGPVRPTKSTPTVRLGQSTTRHPQPTRSTEAHLPKSLDEEMESFRGKPLLDSFDTSGIKDDEYLRKMKEPDKKTDEDYEDEIKGVPLRRKRNVRLTTLSKIKANKNVVIIQS